MNSNQPKPAEEQLPEIAQSRLNAAQKMICDLCSGHRKWIMRVPAEPDYDPDLVIAAALCELKTQLLAALRENRQKDAKNLEYAIQINAQSDQEVRLLSRIEKLEAQLAEKNAKIVELEKKIY